MTSGEIPIISGDVADLRSRSSAPWRQLWRISGWSLILLGGAGILGWLFTIRMLIQPVQSRGPLRPVAVIAKSLWIVPDLWKTHRTRFPQLPQPLSL